MSCTYDEITKILFAKELKAANDHQWWRTQETSFDLLALAYTEIADAIGSNYNMESIIDKLIADGDKLVDKRAKRQCDNWLISLMDYVEETEAPRVFWLWAGISTIA